MLTLAKSIFEVQFYNLSGTRTVFILCFEILILRNIKMKYNILWFQLS